MNLKGRFSRRDKKMHKRNGVYSIMLKIRNANNIAKYIRRHPEEHDNRIGKLVELTVSALCDLALKQCAIFQSNFNLGGIVSNSGFVSPYVDNQEKIL